MTLKSKGTAILLALFLGGLGAHKFYLGKSGQGILYLVFCWALIPGLLALIDLIRYICTSDDDWNKRYNSEQLELIEAIKNPMKYKAEQQQQ